MGSTGGGRAGRHTRVLGCSPWAAHTFLFLSAARWTAPLDLAPCSLPRSRVVTSVPPLIFQTRGAHGKYGRGAGWLPREGTGLLPMGFTPSSSPLCHEVDGAAGPGPMFAPPLTHRHFRPPSDLPDEGGAWEVRAGGGLVATRGHGAAPHGLHKLPSPLPREVDGAAGPRLTLAPPPTRRLPCPPSDDPDEGG
jgi:hypothetical protein